MFNTPYGYLIDSGTTGPTPAGGNMNDATRTMIIGWANAKRKTTTGPGTPITSLPMRAMADIRELEAEGVVKFDERALTRGGTLLVLVPGDRA